MIVQELCEDLSNILRIFWLLLRYKYCSQVGCDHVGVVSVTYWSQYVAKSYLVMIWASPGQDCVV